MFRQLLLLVVATLLAAAIGASAQTKRDLRLTAADDVGIIGTYFPSEKSQAPAVILLHSLNQTRQEWEPFAALLQRNGIAALTIDLRGHGESTRRLTAQGPVLVDVKSFTPRDFQDMLLDVNAAMNWLQDQPDIDKGRIAIVGSSIGANVALRFAMFDGQLAAVALLSPGVNYRGLRTDDAVNRIGKTPLRIFVSRNDAFAFESSKRLMDIRKDAGNAAATNELIVCSGNLHGADMLRGVKGTSQMLLDWLTQTLAAAPAASP